MRSSGRRRKKGLPPCGFTPGSRVSTGRCVNRWMYLQRREFPGVSACFGAAADLNLEYTLPGISQSLIITRMAGRTAVPERESIESFAAHQASMAVYLSAGMVKELSKRLIDGGYAPDTPAAIVYKATWPDEEAYVCTVETLAAVAVEHQITKTALILVGDVLAAPGYERSKLYDPGFTTGYRKAKKEQGETK